MIYSTTFKFVMAQRFLTTTLTILSFMSTVDKCVGVVFYLLSLLSFYVNKPYYLLSLKSFYIRLSYDFIIFFEKWPETYCPGYICCPFASLYV